MVGFMKSKLTAYLKGLRKTVASAGDVAPRNATLLVQSEAHRYKRCLRRSFFEVPLSVVLAILPAVGYSQEQLTDPTRPALAIGHGAASESPTINLRLESVIIGKHRQQAIINGEVYQVGQMIGSAKLLSISAQTVNLQQDGRVQTLSLFPGLERTRVDHQAKSSTQDKKR